jgi:class 3 adenylate cyclase/tetratricopeptide (TPR) repeat protein
MPTDKPQIGASDRRQATVIFADISGFTALSQKMDPEDVAETIDACFRIIEQQVLHHGGTVDKFIGDCVMAVFGAPKALEHAPRQAVNASIAIRTRIQRFGREHSLPAPIDVHIGVNTGLVVSGDIGGDVKRDYTVMGPTVNLASRLQNAAGDGQIYVGETTYRVTHREFVYTELRALSLKGIDEPVTAYELESGEPSLYGAKPATEGSVLVSSLVGRDHELDVLTKRLTALKGGDGGIVSIEAPNGMGKSRLYAEARGLDAAMDVTFLEGRCLSIGGSLSFHPFVDLMKTWLDLGEDLPDADRVATLRAHVDDLGVDRPKEVTASIARSMGLDISDDLIEAIAGVEGDALEKLIHRGYFALFEKLAHREALTIVIEDLHWADKSSIALLEALLPLVDRSGILFLVLFRPGYDDTSAPFGARVSTAYALRSEHLALEPLGARDCDRLIDNLLGTSTLPHETRRHIKEKTDGNPFYVEEVLRSLVERGGLVLDRGKLTVTDLLPELEIPGTIEEVITSRVDRLDESCRHVLQMASVVGRRFFLAILEQLVEDVRIEEALEVLVERQFVRKSVSRRTGNIKRTALRPETEYIFQHALVQDAVYASLLKRTRRSLHARCAAAIEKRYADRIEDFYGMLAYHYSRAEKLDIAEAYLVKAGEEAARSAASAEALQYFREAYRIYLQIHGDDGDNGKKAVLEKNIGLALLNTGALSESIDHFNRALEFYGERVPVSRPALIAKFVVDFIRVMFNLYSGSARRGAGRSRENDEDLFKIMTNRCRAQNQTDPERSFFDNMAAMGHTTHLDTSQIDRAAGIYAAIGAFFAFSGLSFRIGQRFLDVAAEVGLDDSEPDRFQLLAMGSVLAFHSGDWDHEHDISDELLLAGLRVGLLWDADVYLGMITERDIRQGNFDAAGKSIEKLEALQTEYGYEFASSNVAAMRAMLLIERRDLEGASAAIDEYYEIRHEDTLHVLALSWRARIEVHAGRLENAVAALGEAEEVLARTSNLVPFYSGAYWTSRLLVDLALYEATPSRSTGKKVQRSIKRAVRGSSKIAREAVEATRLAARFYWADGSRKKAFAFWTRALEIAEQLDARPERARTALDIGVALQGADDVAEFMGDDANAWFASAASGFAALGLDWDLARLPAPFNGSQLADDSERAIGS